MTLAVRTGLSVLWNDRHESSHSRPQNRTMRLDSASRLRTSSSHWTSMIVPSGQHFVPMIHQSFVGAMIVSKLGKIIAKSMPKREANRKTGNGGVTRIAGKVNDTPHASARWIKLVGGNYSAFYRRSALRRAIACSARTYCVPSALSCSADNAGDSAFGNTAPSVPTMPPAKLTSSYRSPAPKTLDDLPRSCSTSDVYPIAACR